MASFPKIILIGSLCIFTGIGVLSVLKKKSHPVNETVLNQDSDSIVVQTPKEFEKKSLQTPREFCGLGNEKQENQKLIINADEEESVDRIFQFFSLGINQLPIVETIAYNSRVSWLQGRPAWIADYAQHFKTSKHFIARSLNKKADYLTQKVATGDRFNVLRQDVNFNFYLLIDLSRCRMWFYYLDLDTNQRVLLKSYKVGVGRLSDFSASGTLTPLGRFRLGSKVAIYKPGDLGLFQKETVEMVRIFGTRWIPLEPEEETNSQAYYGYGLHGAPWEGDPATIENSDCIGIYGSDGCIRLSQEDMEELFAIVISRPTIVEIVRDKALVELPGSENPNNSLEFIDNAKP